MAQNRIKLLGMKVLDWSRDEHVKTPRTRIVWPDLADSEDLLRMQVYRWLQRLAEGPEILVHTRRPEWTLPWWETVPRYLNWARDMSLEPRMGFIPVIRTQKDADLVAALQLSQFPMRKLVLQCFPRERIKIPPADAVWVGALGPEWMPSYIMREEWIEDLRDQAAPGTFAFRSWGSFWPKRLGGDFWVEKDGYLRGPKVPPIDAAAAGTYPSWFKAR